MNIVACLVDTVDLQVGYALCFGPVTSWRDASNRRAYRAGLASAGEAFGVKMHKHFVIFDQIHRVITCSAIPLRQRVVEVGSDALGPQSLILII